MVDVAVGGEEHEIARLQGRAVSDLDAALPRADFVSIHCPKNPETVGLFNAARLGRMKKGAFIVNTARGGLIDSAALVEALRNGTIGGAAIDVLPQEPPLDGNPLVDPSIPNLILTPHIAWAAKESRQRCVDQVAANIADFLKGGTRNRVV